MNSRRSIAHLLALAALLSQVACAPSAGPASETRDSSFLPGSRVLLDAHNCYPYHGQWANRIERALSTGVPLAIEQDLAWYTDAATNKSWSIVAHNEPFSGEEPTLREHFFERVRPLIEKALAEGDSRNWPLITLNLDFKTEQPEHLAAIWKLLGEYEPWLSSVERGEDSQSIAPIAVKPILILTGESDAQERVFHDGVPMGGRLLVFGAVRVQRGDPGLTPEQSWEYSVSTPPETLVPQRAASNYRRWWNNSWFFVEKGGATRAAEWMPEDEQRLQSLVRHAHAQDLWIRFYTLNGHDPADESQGWGAGYNFGSRAEAEKRWRAANAAGVDFIATDQYEDLAATLPAVR
jgi:hypothetical protein